MTAIISKYKFHILIILTAILILFSLDFILQLSIQNIRFWDSLSYVEAAKGLYLLHCGNAYRPFLMAFITGLPYLFGGNENTLFVFSFWLNLFCWIGFFIIQFELMKQFIQPKIAFLFVLFSMFFISNAVSVFHLLTENIFMFMVILALYCIQEYIQTLKFKFLSIATSIFILTVLIKPGMKFFVILFLIYYFRTIYINKKNKISLLIYGSLLLIFAQCAGIKYQFGTYTISFIDSVTYYNYLGYKAHCFEQNKLYDEKPERLGYLYGLEYDLHKRIVSGDLIDQLKSNKINLMKAYLDDFRDNFSTGSLCIEACKNIEKSRSFDFWKKFTFNITVWQNIIFTIISLIAAVFSLFIVRKNNILMPLIAFFIIYIISTAAISCSQGDRFHVVLFPFAMILIAHLFAKNTKLKI
ncbi:MAG: hypothetical protein H7174_09210 [Flavobacterium sp.]|nr:hypothetical protein [Flavobacterium sp.]